MQTRQDSVVCEIHIQGIEDWKEPLLKEVKVEYPWSHMLRKFEAPFIEVVQKAAEFNGESFERAALETLLREGYRFEELECEFEGHPEWGLGVWYKEHPAYIPVKSMFGQRDPSYYYAMFRTEKAGDQQFCLYSVQCGAILHKTLIYRKVVLFRPEPKSLSAKS